MMMKDYLPIAIALIYHDNQVLLAQRKVGDSFGGYLEFIGGKIEPNECASSACARELCEELAQDWARHGAQLMPFGVFDYDGDRGGCALNVHAFLWQMSDDDYHHWRANSIGAEGQALIWLDIETLMSAKMPPANDVIKQAFCRYIQAYAKK